jgi:hypothetical protein
MSHCNNLICILCIITLKETTWKTKGRWGQNGSYRDWLGGCGLDSTGSGQGPVAGCCECGVEPSGSCATELVLLRYEHIII